MKKYLHCIVEAVRFIEAILYWAVQKVTLKGETAIEKIEDRIVVVGNGPSAKGFPYELASGFKFCCVNFFALNIELFRRIKPTFYCFVEKNYLVLHREEPDVQRLFEILEEVDWDMVFICMAGDQINFKNSHIKIRRLNECHLEYNEFFSSVCMKLYGENKAICGMQNVVIGALYFFVISHAREVLLTGVENDWHREFVVDEDNNVIRKIVHFYGIKSRMLTGSDIQKGEFYKSMRDYYITLYQYKIIADFANRSGVKIINTVLDSYIDVFDKRHVLKCLE